MILLDNRPTATERYQEEALFREARQRRRQFDLLNRPRHLVGGSVGRVGGAPSGLGLALSEAHHHEHHDRQDQRGHDGHRNVGGDPGNQHMFRILIGARSAHDPGLQGGCSSPTPPGGERRASDALSAR